MKQYIFLAFILLFFLIFSHPVQAAGQQEDKLALAKELFDQKKYDEARTLCSQVMNEDPEKREEAVKLLNRIRTIEEQYLQKYEELIITLYEEQDVEKGRDIIEEIKEIYPNPNEEIQKSISLAEETSNLVVNNNLFEDIMDSSQEQLSKREFVGAVETYISGFAQDPPRDLHRNEYETAEFGTIVETDLNAAYTTLKTLTDSFISLGPEIIEKTDEILTAISFLDEKSDIPSPIDLLENYVSIQGNGTSIKDAALFIKSQNDKLKERIEEKNRILYLKYSYQIVMGRDSSGETEGIYYAFHALSNTLSIGIKDTYVKEAGILAEQGKISYKTGEYTKAETSFKRAFEIISQVLPVTWFLDQGQKPETDYSIQSTGNWIIGDSLLNFMEIQEQAKEILAYLYFIENLPDSFSFQELSDVPTVNQFNQLEKDLQSYKEIIITLSNDWETYIRDRSEKTTVAFDQGRAESIIALCAEKASSIISEEFAYLSLMYNDIDDTYEQEKNLLENGIEHNQYNFVYYPDQRVENFKRLNSTLVFISGKLQNTIEEWKNRKEVNTAFERIINQADSLYENINTLLENIAEQQKTAENNILQAGKLKNLGDLRNSEARRAEKARDFRRALQKIEEALAAYNESLSFREDSEVRRSLDQLSEFKTKVAKDEREFMVFEVRKLVENGIDKYKKGFYKEAYDTLLKALSEWEIVREDKNFEIMDWLGRARAAFEIESSRIIDETDPLYKEMSQLYNHAKEYYNQGMQLKKAGKNSEASNMFDKAAKNLSPILAEFPHNKDARLLDLYIRKETGEDFEKTFEEQIDKAENKKEGTREDKLTAYYDLKDLEDIDPNYRGLKSLISELEFALGLKIKPPSEKDKKESRELSAKARPYIENRQFDYYDVARNYLRQALQLDPDNKEAKELLDEMGALAE